jgi:hypothetical protein
LHLFTRNTQVIQTAQHFLENYTSGIWLSNTMTTLPLENENKRDAADRLGQRQSLRITQGEAEYHLTCGSLEGIVKEQTIHRPGTDARAESAERSSESGEKEAIDLERADVMAKDLRGLNLGELWDAFVSAIHADTI